MKIYIVITTEYEEYRSSHVFDSKFEAEKFIRHKFMDDGWDMIIEEKEVIK